MVKSALWISKRIYMRIWIRVNHAMGFITSLPINMHSDFNEDENVHLMYAKSERGE